MDSLDVDTALKVGIQGVDTQHKAIAKMVDALSAWSESDPSAESITDAMTTIGRLIREHFNSEEKVLAQLGAPAADIEAHKNDHTRLVNEYVDLLMNMINGKPVCPERLGAFLRGWLSEHIVNYDLKIREYLPSHLRT